MVARNSSGQEKMAGQRGMLRALAEICPGKLFLTQRKSRFSGGSLFAKTSACSLAPLSDS